MSDQYTKKISESLRIANQYFDSVNSILAHIGKGKVFEGPCAKLFLHSGGNLSRQILKSLELKFYQLAVVGLRSLFELSVNSNYIYNHPNFVKDRVRALKLSQEYLELVLDTNARSHTKLDNKNLKTRAEEVLKTVYDKNYPLLCGWAHLQGQTPYLYDIAKGEKFGISVAQNVLHALHNIFDPICVYFDFPLNSNFEKQVSGFN